jgi:hypothetical protein
MRSGWYRASIETTERGERAMNTITMDLASELQKIYDSEINIEIGWFWDSGIRVRLGDTVNGHLAEENVNTVADIGGRPEPSEKLMAAVTNHVTLPSPSKQHLFRLSHPILPSTPKDPYIP